MIRNKHLQEKIYGREMTQSDYKKLYLDAINDNMVIVSNDPRIDNVGEYYLTKEQVHFMKCFGRVLVSENQKYISTFDPAGKDKECTIKSHFEGDKLIIDKIIN